MTDGGRRLRGDVPARRRRRPRWPSCATELDALGDSLVVVGGDGLWNVHVHVDDVGPGHRGGLRRGPAVPDQGHLPRRAVTHRAPAPGRGVVVGRARATGSRRCSRSAARSWYAATPARGRRCPAMLAAIRRGAAARWWCCPTTTGRRGRGGRGGRDRPRGRRRGQRAARPGPPCRGSPRWPCTIRCGRFDDDVVAMTDAAGHTPPRAPGDVADREALTSAGRLPARRRARPDRRRRRGDRRGRSRRWPRWSWTGCWRPAASWSPWSRARDAPARLAERRRSRTSGPPGPTWTWSSTTAGRAPTRCSSVSSDVPVGRRR